MLWVSAGLLFCLLIVPKIKYLFKTHICQWYARPLTWLQTVSFLGVYDFARYWNNYAIHGLENLRNTDGNCLLVGYHSRCTLDLVYALVAIQPGVIATHMMFKIPIMGWLLSQVNIMPSGTDSQAEKGFVDALASKRPVLLLPGGVYECLKPLAEMHKLQWKPVPGFARIIHSRKDLLGSNTRVVPFYTKNCERCMFRCDWIYENFGILSTRMYDLFRQGHYWFMPVMLTIMFTSVGFKILPPPVKLDTYLGEAVILRENETVEAFAQRVQSATQELIEHVEALPETESEVSKLWRSKVPSDKVRLMFLCTQVLLVGTYTAIQNTCVVLGVIALIWLPVVLAYYGAWHLCWHADSALFSK